MFLLGAMNDDANVKDRSQVVRDGEVSAGQLTDGRSDRVEDMPHVCVWGKSTCCVMSKQLSLSRNSVAVLQSGVNSRLKSPM